MTFMRWITAAALALILGTGAASAQIEKPRVQLGVGGKVGFYYLPLTIAEVKGYFKEQGLDVEISDFAGGSKSLQALVGGSVDVVTGAYEHTIDMQIKGQDIRAILELGRFPGICLTLKKDKAAGYKSFADLKGMKIGVTAPGSSTNFIAAYAMAKAGLSPKDAAFIGVGGSASTALAAWKKGDIDAISHPEPTTSLLEATGDAVVIVDTRTPEGTAALFGNPSLPAAVLYTRKDFIDKYPGTAQALVNGLYKALKWLQTASPEDIANTVPAAFLGGDRKLFVAAATKAKLAYSQTGIIPEAGMNTAFGMLKQFQAEAKNADPSVLAKTWEPRFVMKAAETIK